MMNLCLTSLMFRLFMRYLSGDVQEADVWVRSSGSKVWTGDIDFRVEVIRMNSHLGCRTGKEEAKDKPLGAYQCLAHD